MRGRGDGVGRGRRDPDDGSEWIGRLLRAEAERHEPDRDRILALLREREAAAPVAGERRGGRGRQRVGRPEPARRPARGGFRGQFGWPLVAGSAAVVAVASVATAQVVRTTGEQSQGQATPVITATGTRSLGPATSIETTPPAGHTPTGGQSEGPATSGPGTPAGRPTASLADAISVGVAPTGWATTVTFPRGSDRDWIVVGSRKDGVLVRDKRPTRDPGLGTVTVSGTGASVVGGPFRISYSGGAPEQSHSGVDTWQSVTASTGTIRVSVPASGPTYTVDLFAGAVRTNGMLTIRPADGSAVPVQASLPGCSTDVCAQVISVTITPSRLPGGGGSRELVLELSADQHSGLGVGLAAVALR